MPPTRQKESIFNKKKERKKKHQQAKCLPGKHEDLSLDLQKQKDSSCLQSQHSHGKVGSGDRRILEHWGQQACHRCQRTRDPASKQAARQGPTPEVVLWFLHVPCSTYEHTHGNPRAISYTGCARCPSSRRLLCSVEARACD